jgi:uncharacterized protein
VPVTVPSPLSSQPAEPGQSSRARGQWRLAGLVLLSLLAATVIALALWAQPPGWLHGPREQVVALLHWVRAHWLTSGALAAVAAWLAVWIGWRQLRGEQQRAERQRTQRAADATAARAALLAEHCWVDEATGWLPRVSSLRDPVALGVHPAAELPGPTGAETEASGAAAADGTGQGSRRALPAYVPRDADAALDEALAQGGLVLLRGDSAAGKSRAAYEAMRRLPGDPWVLIPHERGSLRALVEGGIELREVVVWLNGLERFLGVGGLDVGLLRRLAGDGSRRVVVLATMLTSEYAARSPEREHDRAGAGRDLLRAERELLDRAVGLELPRRFTGVERERAHQRASDPRIADALRHSDQYGLAEYLAAGPQLLAEWRNAREVTGNAMLAAGAGLVAAAVDCRRMGLDRSAPISLLGELARSYVDESVAGQLDPEALERGLVWATKLRYGATTLLSRQSGHRCEVFDYLVDAVERDEQAPAIPDRIWRRAIDAAEPKAALAVARRAELAGRRNPALQGYLKAAAGGEPWAMDRLGQLAEERGDLDEATAWYRKGAAVGDSFAMSSLGRLAEQHGDLEEATMWYQKAVAVGDSFAMGDLGRLAEQRGDLEEAVAWYARAGDVLAMNDLGRLARGGNAHAIAALDKAAQAGNTDAMSELGQLAEHRGDLEAASAWYQKAFDRVLTMAKHLDELLELERRAGNGSTEALEALHRFAVAGDPRAMDKLASLALRQGDLDEARAWMRKATDARSAPGSGPVGTADI